MQINLTRVEFSELRNKEPGEASAAIRERVRDLLAAGTITPKVASGETTLTVRTA